MTRADTAATAPAPALARTVGPAQLTFYALGSMLGSGIYGLIGQAAGEVGAAVWLAFLVALVAAMLTALSYACLGSRYPRAAGAAYVAERAFRSPLMGFLVGLCMVASALTSVATQSRVFAANLVALLGVETAPVSLVALGFLLLLSAVVLRGIRESMWLNVVCTIVEAGGLLLVIAVGLSHWGSADLLATPDPARDVLWLLMLQGAVLTFFSFLGFEDAINVAEEARDPERTIPIGLISAMVVAAALYVGVAITAVSVVPPAELARAPGPLTEVVTRAAPWFPAVAFTAVTLFAVANTALVNYVTASRALYGMARQKLLPGPLGRVHPRTRTPHVAIAALLLVIGPLAFLGTIGQLAAATVLLLLVVFGIVNAALVLLKRRPGEPRGRFEVPLIVPAAGAAVCAALVAVRVATGDWRAPATAGLIVLVILALYAWRKASRGAPRPDGVG
jgi:amino acid transporter